MSTLVTALLVVLNPSTPTVDPEQPKQAVPPTWLRYLPAASEEPKEMEIVLRVRCEPAKHAGSDPTWRPELWDLRDQRPVHEQWYDNYGYRIDLTAAGLTRAEPFPLQISTVLLKPATPMWNFDVQSCAQQSGPPDASQPKTLTITHIELKVALMGAGSPSPMPHSKSHLAMI
jgi:hypothetical protein